MSSDRSVNDVSGCTTGGANGGAERVPCIHVGPVTWLRARTQHRAVCGEALFTRSDRAILAAGVARRPSEPKSCVPEREVLAIAVAGWIARADYDECRWDLGYHDTTFNKYGV